MSARRTTRPSHCPSIHATFRYSIFLYGALCAHAPQYSAHLAGLQNSDVTPYSYTVKRAARPCTAGAARHKARLDSPRRASALDRLAAVPNSGLGAAPSHERLHDSGYLRRGSPAYQATASVGTTATLVWSGTAASLAAISPAVTLRDITVINTGANPIYVGGTSVSNTTGMYVAPGADSPFRAGPSPRTRPG